MIAIACRAFSLSSLAHPCASVSCFAADIPVERMCWVYLALRRVDHVHGRALRKAIRKVAHTTGAGAGAGAAQPLEANVIVLSERAALNAYGPTIGSRGDLLIRQLYDTDRSAYADELFKPSEGSDSDSPSDEG